MGSSYQRGPSSQWPPQNLPATSNTTPIPTNSILSASPIFAPPRRPKQIVTSFPGTSFISSSIFAPKQYPPSFLTETSIPNPVHSTSPTNLAFGYGSSSCPGRYFAAVQLKLLFIRLLLDYDISFPEGQTARPENFFVDERIVPDTKQEVRFQRRVKG